MSRLKSTENHWNHVNSLDVAEREAYCSENGFETFDPSLVTSYRWKQDYPILKEDFLVHVGSNNFMELDFDYQSETLYI